MSFLQCLVQAQPQKSLTDRAYKRSILRKVDSLLENSYVMKEAGQPSKIWLNWVKPAPGATVTMLGVQKPLKWEAVGNGVIIDSPLSVQKQPRANTPGQVNCPGWRGSRATDSPH